ncbi:MAG: hypothetical protein QOD48_1837, partial [Gaiellaceae bacterium]|nr:hypothetical protein [Gaiellaceae bacterium]
ADPATPDQSGSNGNNGNGNGPPEHDVHGLGQAAVE